MINLGLKRISRLLTKLSTPTWQAIHIAGTNGKGSVASYLSSLFLRSTRVNTSIQSQGIASSEHPQLRIGKFTSPHLIDRWDCITINDKPVSESLFLAVEQRVKSLALTSTPTSSSTLTSTSTLQESQQPSTHQQANESSETEGEGAGPITQFELLTATAFEIFTEQKCQVAIIECGLGGRLDATNAMNSSNVAVSVITKIGLDHQSFLGDTVSKIAAEKAGIIRKGVPVVVDGSNLAEVTAVISDIAGNVGADCVVTDGGGHRHQTLLPATSENDIPPHQKQNLELALLAFKEATGRIRSLDFQPFLNGNNEDIIRAVLADFTTSNPGRLQHISVTPIIPAFHNHVLLDGAHNPQAAAVLRQYVDKIRPEGARVVWVTAMSQGKDATSVLRILLDPRDQFVACGFGAVDGMPWVRCMDPADLADLAREFVKEVECCPDVIRVLKDVCHGVHNSKDMIVVAGSLYLVSDLLRALRTAGYEAS